jgi:hypothetical protein
VVVVGVAATMMSDIGGGTARKRNRSGRTGHRADDACA